MPTPPPGPECSTPPSAGRAAATALALALLAACGPRPAAAPTMPLPAEGEFSVMTYNLLGYRFEDRDRDGQENDPKPEAERKAVVGLIAKVNPDVLAVEEIGCPVVLEEFRHALQDAGVAYDHIEYLRRGPQEQNLAVLSRFPIVGRQSHTDDRYSIGEAQLPVARGFVDIDIDVGAYYTFRLMVAHLKSKIFHPLGQTEMRRNEARILGRHVRDALKENPELNLLVVGDMNDTYASAALREIIGKDTPLLVDLRPQDAAGAVWTRFDRGLDEYERIDYMLASHAMLPEVVTAKTYAVRDDLTRVASDHRPLVAVFRAHDLPAAP